MNNPPVRTSPKRTPSECCKIARTKRTEYTLDDYRSFAGQAWGLIEQGHPRRDIAGWLGITRQTLDRALAAIPKPQR